MKQETKYVRHGRVIRNLENNVEQQYDYINEAKRASRKLQGDDLGSGLVERDRK